MKMTTYQVRVWRPEDESQYDPSIRWPENDEVITWQAAKDFASEHARGPVVAFVDKLIASHWSPEPGIDLIQWDLAEDFYAECVDGRWIVEGTDVEEEQ